MPQESLTPMIELRHVTKRFDGTDSDAVGSLDLAIEEGQIVVLVGPSGCGKTTTLRMINRLIEPTAGDITVGGRNVRSLPAHELRRTIGYVIQQIGLFPHRTIAQNIATVPELLGWSKSHVAERVSELTELVAIDPSLLTRYPSELSGGQRQRVGVARALAADPPVLLMDEPFGAVDPIIREHLQSELLGLQARLHKTIVLVTHDIDEAILVGDKVAILNTGGVLEQYAAPAELLASPANTFVAGFLGTDRGLKRLSLMTIDRRLLVPGPSIQIGSAIGAGIAVMDEHDIDWLLVLSGETVVGVVSRTALTAAAEVSISDVATFDACLDSSASLKEALDVIMTTNGRYAAICTDGRFEGMVSTGAISREISR